MANWGDLYQDILRLIIAKLELIDHIGFSCVCSLWRSVGLEYRASTIPTGVIGLIIPGGTTTSSQTRRFLANPTTTTKAINYGEDNLDLPILAIPHLCLCRGSYKGWLAMVDNSLNMYLQNPYLRSRVDLPRVSKLPFYERRDVRYRYEYHNICKWFVRKVILSTSPTAKVCHVVAFYDIGKSIAFCSTGDNKEWKTVDMPNEDKTFMDGTFFKGKFYLVDSVGSVYFTDFTNPCPKLSEFGVSIAPQTTFEEKWYIVSADDDLFLIKRELELYDNKVSEEEAKLLYESDEEAVYPPPIYSEDNEKYRIDTFDYDHNFSVSSQKLTHRTEDFIVFRLVDNDSAEQKWTRAEDLNGAAIFLGYNQSIGLPKTKLMHYEGDVIYYTDDFVNDHERFCLRAGYDMGAFRLRDSSIRPLYLTSCRSTKPSAIWFSPMVS